MYCRVLYGISGRSMVYGDMLCFSEASSVCSLVYRESAKTLSTKLKYEESLFPKYNCDIIMSSSFPFDRKCFSHLEN